MSENKIASKEYYLNKYVESLSEKELKAYHIAKSHLGSSFSLEKSKGFIDWKKIVDTPTQVSDAKV
jgi:hypothetical protein